MTSAETGTKFGCEPRVPGSFMRPAVSGKVDFGVLVPQTWADRE